MWGTYLQLWNKRKTSIVDVLQAIFSASVIVTQYGLCDTVFLK